MTLHQATEIIKKIFIGIGIGIGVMVVLTLIFRIGIFIKDLAFPQKIKPPNQAYGDLPALQFPINNIDNSFTYTLNTVSGTLPADFPDRLNVYQIAEKSPSLLSLDKAKEKVKTLGFVDQQGKALPETSLGNGMYQWTESTGVNRKISFDTLSFDFSMSSGYLSSLTVLSAQNLSDESNAIQATKEFLSNIGLFATDIDLTKTQDPQSDANYTTAPRLYTIGNGTLLPTSSLSTAKVIRVDLYQNDIKYELETGKTNTPKISMQIPILYPNPPFSTMSFWVASGQNNPEIDAADFVHQDILMPTGTQAATYPIKTPQAAFEELKNGKAYIASYLGLEKDIQITNVFLAYYIGAEKQKYLMPIIVFEGPNNFFAYVSAIKDDWVKANSE